MVLLAMSVIGVAALVVYDRWLEGRFPFRGRR